MKFFRERLLEGVRAGGDFSIPFDYGISAKKFSSKDLQTSLGLKESQVKALMGSDELITEWELFERVKNGKVFNVSLKDGAKGDSFEDYNNGNLLSAIDGLDGDKNIKLSSENKDITWIENTTSVTAVEPQDLSKIYKVLTDKAWTDNGGVTVDKSDILPQTLPDDSAKTRESESPIRE